MNRPVVTIGMLIGALVLCACGKIQTLDQPAPLYGAKAKADYRARKAAEAAAKAQKKDDRDPEVLPDVKYDPNADPGPQRLLPIPGTNPAPNDPGQPGVLPDPMNNPGPNPGPG